MEEGVGTRAGEGLEPVEMFSESEEVMSEENTHTCKKRGCHKTGRECQFKRVNNESSV